MFFMGESIMKILERLALSVFVCFALGTIATAQTSGTSGPYDVVEIEEFTVRDGVEFPAEDVQKLAQALVNNFNQSRRFSRVFLSSDTQESAPVRRVRISGEIIKYDKGSRAKRYLVGFGTGKTKIIADVKLIDVESGDVVLQHTVDGVVSMGILGGGSDDAKGGLASALIKTMTKKGLAGAKRRN
jgi:curli biogenesis system outer membrane secretion channel CsgG